MAQWWALGHLHFMKIKHFTLAVTVLVACVICYWVGYHRGAEWSPFQAPRHTNMLIDLQGESRLAALSSIHANILHPNSNTVVMGGMVKH
jgi:hypothetical protein